MLRCSQCSTANPDGASTCEQCEAKLSAADYQAETGDEGATLRLRREETALRDDPEWLARPEPPAAEPTSESPKVPPGPPSRWQAVRAAVGNSRYSGSIMLSGIALAVLLAYQYRPFVSLVVVAVVAIAWGIWAILGGSRGVAYSLGVALLILGAIGTVGILDEGSDEFQSTVVSRAAVQHTHEGIGEREGSYQETHYLLRLVCPCTETGALGLEVSASLYRRNPRIVLLEHTSESLLGLWGDRLAGHIGRW